MSATTAHETRLVALSCALLALAAFLVLRPYEGIVHDARLYVGYALAPLDPDGIGRDIVFTLDKQAGKTVYPVLLRALAVTIGLTPALLVLTYGALVLWFSAAWRLVQSIVPDTMRLAGVTATVVLLGALHTIYGGASTIRFAEPLATPRVLAEAIGMLAMVQAFRGARWTVGVLLISATVIHPIMAAPVVAVIVLTLVPDDRARGGLLLAGLLAGILLAFAATLVTSQSALLGRFDAAWVQVLDSYRTLTMLRNWSGIDLARVVLQLVTLGIVRRCAHPAAVHFIDAVALVSVGGLLLSAIGVDLLSHRLMGQAQLWRALWLAGVLSGIALAIIVHTAGTPESAYGANDAQRAIRQRMSAILLVGAWMLLPFTASAAYLALTAWCLWTWPELNAAGTTFSQALRFPPVAPLALALVLGLGVAVYIALQSVITWQVLGGAPAGAMPSIWYVWYRSGLPAIALTGGALFLLVREARRSSQRASASLPVVLASTLRLPLGAACAMAIAVLLLDQRTPHHQAMEKALARVFTPHGEALDPMRGEQTVAWPDTMLESWAFLGRPAWGTVNQGVPRVFSRELALQWARRFDALLDTSDETSHGAAHVRQQRIDLALSDLQRICGMEDAPWAIVVTLPSQLVVPGETLILPAPLFDPPNKPKDAWRAIDSVRVVPCGSVPR